MKIIVGGKGYPEKRNIITDPSHRYLDYRSRNIWTWINVIRQRLLHQNKLFIFRPLPLMSSVDADIIHLFNEVSSGPGDWVATFETELPRVLPVGGIVKFDNPELARELRYVCSSRCKGIIAISEATRQIQLRLLEHFPREQAIIGPKLHVLHPPQPVIQEKNATVQEGPLTFIFVGKEFYRKGGAEVVLAVSQLLRENMISMNDVRVNMVGDPGRTHNVAHQEFQDDAAFRASIENTLRECPIFRHHTSLSNDAVLEMIKTSDVGLLPTWQETYGFSVLEMQACGCPVITTNVRALPEINPENAGWLIRCPLNSMSELTVGALSDKTVLRSAIVSQLKAHILQIISDRKAVKDRSKQSVARIRREHDPVVFRERLSAIYRDFDPEKKK
ncbi:glycosyltransferase family 4 protein [Pantoea sp. BIGb0393]|uniref:Glycosyltransferase family 4 protein n=1 Tax=Pantoea nemavictus TaxID=2726955 RepID=A0ABU8PYR4_9GAMM|nr:glycosyltransferase family 4 protein [Pantoea nemavictus]MBA0038892.1 glycosyltransferase family 4 protein [Pantoea nemavictus]